MALGQSALAPKGASAEDQTGCQVVQPPLELSRSSQPVLVTLPLKPLDFTMEAMWLTLLQFYFARNAQLLTLSSDYYSSEDCKQQRQPRARRGN